MSASKSGGRGKALLLLSLSMVASAVAILVVLGVVKQAEEAVAAAREAPETVVAVVAARDLNVGLAIAPEDVVEVSMLPSLLPPEGTFASVDELVGRTPRERVLANEVVREGRLASEDAGIGLNAVIEPGHRAMSVEVDSQSGVAGFIRPGNYVDVIVTIRPDTRDARAKWVAHNFLQGARVLAVGRSMGESRGEGIPEARPVSTREKPTVTIELDPDQAEALALATSKGDIHLVLRNDIDVTAVDTQGTYANAIIGMDEQARPRPRRVARRPGPEPDLTPVSEVIHGGSVERVRFESTEKAQ
jgi:pilus assembly protein CpaB